MELNTPALNINRMRNTGLVLILLMFFGYNSACNDRESKEVKKNSITKLYEIDFTTLVKVEDRDSLEGYVGEYKITKSFTLSNKSKRRLKKAVLDKKNYVNANSRSCEFLPKYAITIDSGFVALVSVGICPKIKYYSENDSTKNSKIVDLRANNEIELEILKSVKGAKR